MNPIINYPDQVKDSILTKICTKFKGKKITKEDFINELIKERYIVQKSEKEKQIETRKINNEY
jgi:hypothetical protein